MTGQRHPVVGYHEFSGYALEALLSAAHEPDHRYGGPVTAEPRRLETELVVLVREVLRRYREVQLIVQGTVQATDQRQQEQGDQEEQGARSSDEDVRAFAGMTAWASVL